MVRKIGIAVIVLGLAAFSPAPINDIHAKHPKQAERSQDKVGQEQKYNGSVPVVGQVPQRVNEVGMQVPPPSRNFGDHSGEDSLLAGTASADKVGATAITQATERVAVETKKTRLAWFFGILIAIAGFGGWKLLQYKIEQSTPVPQFSKRFLREIESGHR